MPSATSLTTLIRQEILAKGPMTVARFMELALYHPSWGYYARPEAAHNIGRKGDFYTNVSTGPLFGKLLAHHFQNLWQEMGQPRVFHLVECGGLNGQLACDILSHLSSQQAEFAAAVRYALVEPLPHLATAQQARLTPFQKTMGKDPRIQWHTSLDSLPSIRGIIFGNELLDAFPVHLFEKCRDGWMECCLGIREHDSSWEWVLQPYPWNHKLEKLPDHAKGRVPVAPDAGAWFDSADRALQQGEILLIDYGWTNEEFFQVERKDGTLRGYRNHRVTDDFRTDPGEQDITSHVRWTPLIHHAEKLGFHMREFIQQGRWLTRLLASQPSLLLPSETRQFHLLTHPEMMGAPFRILELQKT